MKDKVTTWGKKVMLSFFLVAFVFGGLFTMTPQASAQQVVTNPILAAIETQETIYDKTRAALEVVLEQTAAVLFKNTANYFLQTIAADTAKWIASGGKGQEPLFISEGWGDYLQNTAEDAVATGVIDFAKSIGLGNICLPPSIAIDLVIPQIQGGGPRKPQCSLDDLAKTWDVTDPAFLENFSLSFRPGQNDLSVSINFLNNLDIARKAAENEATKKREESFFKSVQTAVSKVIKTPATLVANQVEAPSNNLHAAALAYTGQPIADAINTFSTTLVGQYLQQLQSGVFNLADLARGNDSSVEDQLRSLLDPEATGGADLVSTQVFKPEIKQETNYDLLSDFTSCPAESQYAGVFNCVIDQSFSLAIRGAGSAGFYTVQRALEEDLLHGDWAFGYVDPVSGVQPSHLNGYSYSNMKKLRRARVIPVGWELAALRSRQSGQVITLQEVVDAFDDPSSRYYKLVDPDWVLKIPFVNCDAKVPGQTLSRGAIERNEYCADLKDCIQVGDDGQCLAFGYCTNEKRTWQLPADSCQENFATCDAFTEVTGSELASADITPNQWLGRTLDSAGCTADSAGCLWYSLARNSANEFTDANRVYLTNAAETCDADEGGCREYILTRNGSNMLKNSSFEDDTGNNYVLGGGDSTFGNAVPDGWSARQVSTDYDLDAQDGSVAVVIESLGGNECLPGLEYNTPIGSFVVGQTYTLSGMIKTNSEAERDIMLGFEDLRFTQQAVTDEWTSFAFNFIMPATSDSYTLVLGANRGSCADLSNGLEVFYDAIMLEQGNQATDYEQYGEQTITLANAPACTFEEVGCRTYRPIDTDFGTEVTGIVTGQDLCPAECVGYNTYEQKETELEPTKFENFIPSTARTCSAAAVGCQEFTNLDIVNAGGEGREFYSSIRHCEKPNDDCAPFFAWEGSDITGFQLVSFNLSAGPGGVGGPQTTDGSTSCDIDTNTNCRELIAADGSKYFRDLTKTITCSDQCVPLRAGPGVVTQQECTDRFGEWDATIQRCVYQAIAEESVACSEAAVGCREYLGNTGNNVAVIFTESFEDPENDWEDGERSTESTVVGGHSQKLGGSVSSINAVTSIEIEEEDYAAGKSYMLTFSAKSSVSDVMTITAWLGPNRSDTYRLGAINTSTRNWNQYQVGPVFIPEDTTGTIELAIQAVGSSTKPDEINVFIDDILLRQITNSVFLVKDSWDTPNTCDTDPPLAGGTAGRSMLGCQAYRASAGAGSTTVNIKSFTRLCSEEKIGCEAVIDTHNSTAPYREIFNEGDEAEVIIPEDNIVYRVVSSEYSCNPEAKGCTELGRPIFDQDGVILDYLPTYLINDPDQYTDILCKGEELFCKEWLTSDGNTRFAKDPGLAECIYKPIPDVLPKVYAWYKVGDDTTPNPEECINAHQNNYAQRCPVEAISCTQFYEPITQESYYYKKNTLVDLSSECNGVVDWKQGCVLFNDVSIPEQYFKSGDPDNNRDTEGRRLEDIDSQDVHIDFSGGPLGCQTGDAGCDTNTLMRVNLDRTCTQWLAGVSTSRFYDDLTQQFRTTSYSLGRCIEADPLNPNGCKTWDNSLDKELLNIENYQQRDVTWAGEDFTGYSIPFAYPVETLRQFNLNETEDGDPSDFRLANLVEPAIPTTCNTSADCPQTPDRQVCRQEIDPLTGEFVGTCLINNGVYGTGIASVPECRAYPEPDSPFPSDLAIFAPDSDAENPNQPISIDPFFKNANLGAKGEVVECSYHKAEYQGDTRYYSIENDPPTEITVEGEAQRFKKKSTFYGWEGYCLEHDPEKFINGSDTETACLTWYPVDVIQGAQDLNNSKLSAGFNAELPYYCAEAVFAEYRRTDQYCKGCPNGYDLIFKSRSSTCSGGNHWRLCAPSQGDGWYAYDGTLALGRNQQEQLGVMCSKVARIESSNGRDATWTTRILGADFAGVDNQYRVSTLGWGSSQQNDPYGAALPDVTRLEDLGQPLIVKDLNTYAADCDECEIASGEPWGTCQDDDPLKKGKLCDIRPNAGSPYSVDLSYFLGPGSTRGTFLQDNMKIRADNVAPDQAPQPYLLDETYATGYSRLSELFAKSYGVWEWQGIQNICVGVCLGGMNAGEYCESDNACGEQDPDIVYDCKPNTCVGGALAGGACAIDADCEVPKTGQVHQCVVVTGPDQDPDNPDYVCETGPFAGRGCQSIDDCSEANADGFCEQDSICIATDTSNGLIVDGANSGRTCGDAAQCNAKGSCQVNRCSTESLGTTSGICSGKAAGDSCGAVQNRSQYVKADPASPVFGWDITQSAAPELPVITPVVSDPSRPTGLNELFTFSGGISVNGEPSGTVTGQDGRFPVTVSFYAYNDNGEQMPLRTIMVDWGDASDPSVSIGSFKNRKPTCRRFCDYTLSTQSCTTNEQCTAAFGSTSSCNVTAGLCEIPGAACTTDEQCQTSDNLDAICRPLNFGDSSDACIDDGEASNGFFSFNHTYTWSDDCDTQAADGSCLFTPQVLVRDNWGAARRVPYDGTIVVPAPIPPNPLNIPVTP